MALALKAQRGAMPAKRPKLKRVMSAEPYLPKRRTYSSLKKAAERCQGCPLYKRATQTVFGEGPAHAKILFIGEQPGFQEDLTGHPFVGIAGKILSQAMERAGIERSETYVTNAVKHFKYRDKGDKKIHESPNQLEIGACRPWLKAEVDLLKPQVLVCLGVSAAKAVLGKSVRLGEVRGQEMASPLGYSAVVTAHPASVVRHPTSSGRRTAMTALIQDLVRVQKACLKRK